MSEIFQSVEPSVFSELESSFKNIDDAILKKNAKVVLWDSRDAKVVNVDLPNGKGVGYAEHKYAIQALVKASQSIKTKKHHHIYEHMDEIPEGRSTWLDKLLAGGGAKIRASKKDGLIEVSVERFIEVYLNIPEDIREATYQKGELIWEDRGYVYTLTPWPHGKTGQRLPVSPELLEVTTGKPRELGDQYYKLRHVGEGKTFLTALDAATKDYGEEF